MTIQTRVGKIVLEYSAILSHEYLSTHLLESAQVITCNFHNGCGMH